MFKELEKIIHRPEPFQYNTVKDLWNDEYTSQQMLKYHLDGAIDLSSRKFTFIDRSVDWIISHFNINDKKKVADFGCGPGLYTSRLARSGAKVTGIDLSERSILYAKDDAVKNGLEIDYVNDDYLEFQTDNRYDLVIMIMCDMCVLSPSQRSDLLKKFYEVLEYGGSVLLDVYSLKGFQQREEISIMEKNSLNHFWSDDDYFGFLNVVKYDDEKVILDKHTIIEKERTRTIYNWLQYDSKEELAKLFQGSGFKVEGFYSNVAGDPFDENSTEFAIVATKI